MGLAGRSFEIFFFRVYVNARTWRQQHVARFMPRIPTALARLITAIRAVQGKGTRRPRRKEAGSRRKAKERRKVEEEKEEAGLSGVSTLVPLSFRTRDASLSLGRDSGYFQSTRYTAGICRAFVRETKKKRWKLQHFVRVDFPNRSTVSIDLLRSQARILASFYRAA